MSTLETTAPKSVVEVLDDDKGWTDTLDDMVADALLRVLCFRCFALGVLLETQYGYVFGSNRGLLTPRG